MHEEQKKCLQHLQLKYTVIKNQHLKDNSYNINQNKKPTQQKSFVKFIITATTTTLITNLFKCYKYLRLNIVIIILFK